jgi:hypothetical protein
MTKTKIYINVAQSKQKEHLKPQYNSSIVNGIGNPALLQRTLEAKQEGSPLNYPTRKQQLPSNAAAADITQSDAGYIDNLKDRQKE